MFDYNLNHGDDRRALKKFAYADASSFFSVNPTISLPDALVLMTSELRNIVEYDESFVSDKETARDIWCDAVRKAYRANNPRVIKRTLEDW